jgi:hypothetical protein
MSRDTTIGGVIGAAGETPVGYARRRPRPRSMTIGATVSITTVASTRPRMLRSVGAYGLRVVQRFVRSDVRSSRGTEIAWR